MLKQEENKMLTQVGPNTPMGSLLRHYWMPVALSEELLKCDSEPVRVKLLGENLILFRESTGKIGLVSERCPHRGASLFFGRNEKSGLRCVYHGWKFDTDGKCVDLPNESPDCPLKNKVKLQAYPCLERNGVIWTYLGKEKSPPPLPSLEWNLQKERTTFLWRNYRHCNWVQAMEGDLDSSHINFLHSTLEKENISTVPDSPPPGYAGNGIRLIQETGVPWLATKDTETGFLHTSCRTLDKSSEYHRVHPFLFPFHTMVGGGMNENEVSFNGKIWVPMDDEQTLVLEWQFRPDKPWTDKEIASIKKTRMPLGFKPKSSLPAGSWQSPANASNDYLIDRALEKTKLFCGILSNPLQDTAMQESMGPIVDRSKEHLGPADKIIIKLRRSLLKACRALRDEGKIPPGVNYPDLYLVRPVSIILAKDSDWAEATRLRREKFKKI